MFKRKILSLALSALLVFSLTGQMAFAAAEYDDISESWAMEQIERWSNYGILHGDGNGLFRPESNITRGELATILAQVLAYTETAENTFTDLDEDFYTDYILQLVNAGVMEGNGNGTITPTAGITREETAVMLGRAFNITPNAEAANDFPDAELISSWAAGYVGGLYEAGYMVGRDEEDGNYADPGENIQRCEVAQLLDAMMKGFFATEGETYDDTETVDGNAVVNAKDITLKDMTVTGNLYIAEGVGDGDVTLENVIVEGKLIVRGGGANSIIIKGNSEIGELIVSKTEAGAVRIKIEDDADVQTAFIIKGEDGVILAGAFNTVNIENSMDVTLENTDIDSLNINADGVEVTVNEGSTVENALIGGENAVVSGAGAVNAIQVDANNATIEIANTEITVGDDVTGTMVGSEAVEGGRAVTTGDDGEPVAEEPVIPIPNPVPVSGVTVEHEEKSAMKGESFTLTATIAPVDAANKNVTWSSSNEEVATVAADGTVTVVGVGEATITVTTSDGAFTASCVVTGEQAPVTMGNAPYRTLADALEAAVSGDIITMHMDAELTQDAELAAGITVQVTGGMTFTVDANLTVAGILEVSGAVVSAQSVIGLEGEGKVVFLTGASMKEGGLQFIGGADAWYSIGENASVAMVIKESYTSAIEIRGGTVTLQGNCSIGHSIPGANNQYVTVFENASLTLADGANSTIYAGAILHVDGRITVESGATLNNLGVLMGNGTLDNQGGTINGDGGTFEGSFAPEE